MSTDNSKLSLGDKIVKILSYLFDCWLLFLGFDIALRSFAQGKYEVAAAALIPNIFIAAIAIHKLLIDLNKKNSNPKN